MNPSLLDTGHPALRPPATPQPTPRNDDRLDRVLEIVASREPSRLRTHDARCCRLARAWFRALAVSASLQQPGPPAWIRQHWNWGPVEWPLNWCWIPELKTLDCGALAALARAAFEATGAKTVPVQLIERFDAAAVEHWRAAWMGNRTTPPWMWGELVYHEAVGVLDGTRIAIWDPTDSDFVDRPTPGAYASAQAIRIDPPSVDEGNGNGSHELFWHGLSLAPARWIRLAP